MTAVHGGRCQCAALRYELAAAPLTCYACHCLDCQSASGSAFSISMLVPTDALGIAHGSLDSVAFSLRSGSRTRHGCAVCGNTLWVTAPDRPELAALKAVTLDDSGWWRPVAHVWIQSKQPWLSLGSDAITFDQQPKDMSVLIDLWQQRPS